MPVLQVQRDLNVAIAEFAELKEQLERDTLVLSVLKQLQEVREKGDVIPHPDPRPVFHLSVLGACPTFIFHFFPFSLILLLSSVLPYCLRRSTFLQHAISTR